MRQFCTSNQLDVHEGTSVDFFRAKSRTYDLSVLNIIKQNLAK